MAEIKKPSGGSFSWADDAATPHSAAEHTGLTGVPAAFSWASDAATPHNVVDHTGIDGVLTNPPNIVVVDKNGYGDFTSVKAACDWITASGSPSTTNRFLVEIHQGTYEEDPFTLSQYTVLSGKPLNYVQQTYLNATLTPSAAWVSGTWLTGATSGLASLSSLTINANLASIAAPSTVVDLLGGAISDVNITCYPTAFTGSGTFTLTKGIHNLRDSAIALNIPVGSSLGDYILLDLSSKFGTIVDSDLMVGNGAVSPSCMILFTSGISALNIQRTRLRPSVATGFTVAAINNTGTASNINFIDSTIVSLADSTKRVNLGWNENAATPHAVVNHAGITGVPAAFDWTNDAATPHAAVDHAGITGVPSVAGLLDETAHDMLDHDGLSGIGNEQWKSSVATSAELPINTESLNYDNTAGVNIGTQYLRDIGAWASCMVMGYGYGNYRFIIYTDGYAASPPTATAKIYTRDINGLPDQLIATSDAEMVISGATCTVQFTNIQLDVDTAYALKIVATKVAPVNPKIYIRRDLNLPGEGYFFQEWSTDPSPVEYADRTIHRVVYSTLVLAVEGDIRAALDTDAIYYFDGTNWYKIGDVAGLLDETAHDALDHTGLTGIPTAFDWATDAATPHAAVDHAGIPGVSVSSSVVSMKVVLDATTLTTGDAQATLVIPQELSGMNLVSCGAHVFTSPSNATPVDVSIQISNITDANLATPVVYDMLSTPITIDDGEYDSVTALVPAVVDTTKDDVAEGDVIAIDVDSAGSGVKGLEVRLGFSLPQ